jgi:hypothetical protein
MTPSNSTMRHSALTSRPKHIDSPPGFGLVFGSRQGSCIINSPNFTDVWGLPLSDSMDLEDSAVKPLLSSFEQPLTLPEHPADQRNSVTTEDHVDPTSLLGPDRKSQQGTRITATRVETTDDN